MLVATHSDKRSTMASSVGAPAPPPPPPEDPPVEVVVADAEVLVDEPDEGQNCMRVSVAGGSTAALLVTRSAMNSMETAIDWTSNKPPAFIQMGAIVKSVCDILRVDIHQYSMPQTKDELEDFFWDEVVPGHKHTYPHGDQPTDAEFAKVKAVHDVVKSRKDAQAARMELGAKSGVLSYCTYKQKWKNWRDIFAVYRMMYPTKELQWVHATVMALMKGCNSVKDIDNQVEKSIRMHLLKLRRKGNRKTEKQQIEEDLQKAKEEAEAAKQEIDDALEKKKAAERKRKEIMDTSYTTARSRAAAKKAREEDLAKVEEEMKAATEAAKQAKIARVAKQKEQKELKKKQATAKDDPVESEPEPEPESSEVKKRKRSFKGDMTPREKADQDGDVFKPPTRVPRNHTIKYSMPGGRWVTASRRKVDLLNSLVRQCYVEGLLERPMGFHLTLEFLGDSEAPFKSFNERVFIYFVGLSLHNGSRFPDVVQMLLAFMNENLKSPAAFAYATKDQLDAIILGVDPNHDSTAAEDIIAVSKELETDKYNGQLPQDKKGLMDLGVDETVVDYMMQHIFGVTDLVVGLPIRKLVVAVDLHDWEETGAKCKDDVKMTSITADRVKKSLLTWLPRGDRREIQDSLDTLCVVVANNHVGMWGRLKKVMKHFPKKEREELGDMINNIYNFCRLTKRGKAKKE